MLPHPDMMMTMGGLNSGPMMPPRPRPPPGPPPSAAGPNDRLASPDRDGVCYHESYRPKMI